MNEWETLAITFFHVWISQIMRNIGSLERLAVSLLFLHLHFAFKAYMCMSHCNKREKT